MSRHSTFESLNTNMKKLRKSLSAIVMIMMLAVTFGSFANAAAPQAGDLIKMDGLSTVYFLGNDGKRYVYPTSSVYFSWHKDFSGVVTVSASELQSYPLGSNITMRPGTKLVKITTDPSVYAVEANGTLRKIASEADAIAIYGANWAKRVVDVPDAFFTNYTVGTPLASGQVPAGSLVKNANSGTIYLYDGTNYRSIASEAAFNANRYDFANVITLSSAITAGGSAITGAEFAYDAQGGAGTGVVVTGSGLTASLSAATPAAASVPKNGSRVPMAKVNLTAANDGAVTVNSITVKRIGLSSYDDINKVWAEYNGMEIASKKSVNSNDEATLVFSPVLTIPAGSTKTIDVIASLTDAAGNIGLSIASASAVNATAASISGSFPISGNLMSPTDYSVTSVNVTSSNHATADTINIGEEAVELGDFSIVYASSSRDLKVSSIKLKNTGDEDLAEVISDIYLENNSEKVAEGVIDGKYVTFTFNNGGLSMLKDDGTQDFTIYGNVIGKELTSATSGITLELNKTEDLVISEMSSGFGAVVNTSALTVANVDINAGVVAVSEKTTNPDDDTVLANSNNIVALLANIRTDEAINAEGLKVVVDKSSSTAFENVRVYLNGALVDSFDPTATGSNLLDTSVSLKKGDNEVKVTVDTTSNAASGAQFRVKLVGTSGALLDTPEYTNGNTVATADIDGSATGAILTIAGASATIVRTDGYGSKTTVQGSTDVSLGKFTVKAYDDAVTITKITVASTSGNTLPYTSIDDVKVMVAGTQVGSTKSFTSTGISLSSLSVNVAKDATKVIEVFASTDTNATGTLKVALGFTAKDSNGDAVSISSVETVAFTVTNQGSLAVAKDGNTADAAILASKAGVEQAVASYKLTATNDSANVTSLTVTNVSTTDVRIASYKLYNSAGTLLSTANPFAGETEFTIADNALKVAADSSEVVTVKAILNNIENDETATDKVLTLTADAIEFKASNGSKTVSDISVAANTFYIRKTVPTVALMTLPNSTLTSGTQVISKFTVTADSNADVKIGKLVVKVATTSGVTVAAATNGVKVNGTSKNTASAISGSYVTVDFGTSTPEIVSAGTSKTFEIVSNVTVTGSNRESLSTVIEEGAYDVVTAAEYAGVNYMVWSDSASNTDSKNVWFNSFRVKGLPTDTQTISVN
jgi:hypothetical protein